MPAYFAVVLFLQRGNHGAYWSQTPHANRTPWRHTTTSYFQKRRITAQPKYQTNIRKLARNIAKEYFYSNKKLKKKLQMYMIFFLVYSVFNTHAFQVSVLEVLRPQHCSGSQTCGPPTRQQPPGKSRSFLIELSDGEANRLKRLLWQTGEQLPYTWENISG